MPAIVPMVGMWMMGQAINGVCSPVHAGNGNPSPVLPVCRMQGREDITDNT